MAVRHPSCWTTLQTTVRLLKYRLDESTIGLKKWTLQTKTCNLTGVTPAPRGTFREMMSPQPTLDVGRLQLHLTGKKTTDRQRGLGPAFNVAAVRWPSLSPGRGLERVNRMLRVGWGKHPAAGLWPAYRIRR